MPRPIRHPTHMGATGTRSTQRTVRPPTRSTSLPPRDRCQPWRARTVPRLLLGPTPAVNITPRAKHRVPRSTQSKTATSTRTPEAVGNKPSQSQTMSKVAARLPLKGGDSRKRAAGRQPLAEAVGNPGRRVLAVRIAVVVAEVGVGGRPCYKPRIQPAFVRVVRAVSLVARALEDEML